MKERNIPMLTGRIEAYPVLMFSWNCPKCGAFHFKVNNTVEAGETIVKCFNKKCGEKFDRSQFRFNGENQIARIMTEMHEDMYLTAVKDAENELKKAEEADAITA